MIIKTKSQAADQGTHGPILLAAWEAGETSVTVGGKEYELVRGAEPVGMYTVEELIDIYIAPPAVTNFVAMGRVRDAVLARRAEMLRAMCDNKLLGELERAYEDVYPGPANGNGILAVYALVREHIEANRPALTNEIVTDWYNERRRLGECCLDVLKVVAHRAAEYRGPVKGGIDEIGHTGLLRDLAELHAEIERLKRHADTTGDLETIVRHLGLGVGDYSSVAQQIRETGDCDFATILSARSPQPVDDSDEYGILVQNGCVAFVRRLPRGFLGWASSVGTHVSGPHPSTLKIDPARIFKVTSQPRGPLKVPSEEDLHEQYGQSVGMEFLDGARWAIEWIKKANGAE